MCIVFDFCLYPSGDYQSTRKKKTTEYQLCTTSSSTSNPTEARGRTGQSHTAQHSPKAHADHSDAKVQCDQEAHQQDDWTAHQVPRAEVQFLLISKV